MASYMKQGGGLLYFHVLHRMKRVKVYKMNMCYVEESAVCETHIAADVLKYFAQVIVY